jgi:hypothetical protein
MNKKYDLDFEQCISARVIDFIEYRICFELWQGCIILVLEFG